jgi:hypothetical protein
MNKLVVLITIILVYTNANASNKPEQFGSACIGSTSGFGTCKYGISISYISSSSMRAVSIANKNENIVGRNLEELDIAVDSNTESLEFAQCRYDQKFDDTIIALVAHQDRSNDEYLPVTWATKIELPSVKFIPIDQTKVDCYNSGYGL